jgi:hypothetical protein
MSFQDRARVHPSNLNHPWRGQTPPAQITAREGVNSHAAEKRSLFFTLLEEHTYPPVAAGCGLGRSPRENGVVDSLSFHAKRFSSPAKPSSPLTAVISGRMVRSSANERR